MTPTRRQHGLSLIELLTAVVVLSVLVGIATPSFVSLSRRSQVGAINSRLAGDLAYARMEAISRGGHVSICASEDGERCSGQRDYARGWLVYAYPAGGAGPGDAFQEPRDTLLRHTVPRGRVHLQADHADVLSFGPQGSLVTAATRFRLCYARSDGTLLNTASVPGNVMVLRASGGTTQERMLQGDAC